MRCLVITMFVLLTFFKPTEAKTILPAVAVDQTPPDYPDSAANIGGVVKLHFTIMTDGHVKDAVIIDSKPSGIFDAAALAAVAKWRYKLQLIDGKPTEQPLTVVLRIEPDPEDVPVWLNPSMPFYPKAAFDARLEGTVTVGFDLTEQGIPENIHVTYSEPAGVFDAAAVEDVEQRVYKPQPGGRRGMRTSVVYRLDTARLKPKPIKIVNPVYPDGANAIGFCYLEFTVELDGSVSNPVVKVSFPRGIFEKPSLDSIKQWKFQPAINFGGPLVSQVEEKFIYKLTGVSERDEHYLKPGQWIRLEYTLTPEGRAKDVEVVEQSDPDVKTGKALEQIKNMHFQPMIENGVAVEKTHQTVRINY